MNLDDQARNYLAATDSDKFLTYDEYARDRIDAGAKAITVAQWDALISIATGRKLQDTLVVSQIAANMRTAAFSKHNARREDLA